MSATVTDDRPARPSQLNVQGDASRARVGPTRSGVPGDDERRHLREGVGALVRSTRRDVGRSRAWLARATGAHLRTIQRLEAGHRRPSQAFLCSVAYALLPDQPEPLRRALTEAAGESLVPGCDRYWTRRALKAWLTGDRPWPSSVQVPMQLHSEASSAMAAALDMIVPENLDDLAVLDEAYRLIDHAQRLREAAGPPFTLLIGARRFTFGLGL